MTLPTSLGCFEGKPNGTWEAVPSHASFVYDVYFLSYAIISYSSLRQKLGFQQKRKIIPLRVNPLPVTQRGLWRSSMLTTTPFWHN